MVWKLIRRESHMAWQRFKDIFLPPGIRQYKSDKPGVRIYRYPAPGNEPVLNEEKYVDYKTAYRDSIHNIRYNGELHPHNKGWSFIADGLSETIQEKLVRYNFLEFKKMNDTKAVEEAKKKYQEVMEEPVDVRIHHDDFNLTSRLNIAEKRVMISEYVAQAFDDMNSKNAREAWMNDLNEIYSPQAFLLKSNDWTADDPVYRQLVLDLEFHLKAIVENRLAQGKFPRFVGDANFWQILDNSFDEESRKRIQASVSSYLQAAIETVPALSEKGEEIKGSAAKQQEYIPVPTRTQFEP